MKGENKKHVWVDVYAALLPDGDEVRYPVFPRERELELEGISSDSLRREKYHAWRLLEYALEKSLGILLTEAELYRHSSGKWLSPHAELSIAHGGGAIAVAISRFPVGLDIEKCGRALDRGFAERMLTEKELNTLGEDGGEILRIWCKKEALFKRRCEPKFIPRATETVGEPVRCEKIALGGEDYLLAVAAGEGAEINFVIRDVLA